MLAKHSKWLMAMPQFFGGIGLSLLAVFAWNPFEQPLLRRVVAIEPTNIDFGELSTLEIGKTKLVLTNLGRENVEFVLAFECDCTRAEPPSGQIAPGEKFPISLSYRPRGSSDLQSISEELTNIQLKMRTAKTTDSVSLLARAKVIKPFAIDLHESKISANAFGITPFALNLSLCGDVESVDVLASPTFVKKLSVGELKTESNVVTLQGDIVSPESSQKSDIEFGITLKKMGRSDRTYFRISVPLEVTVREPFVVSDSFLQLIEKESTSVHFTPLGGCESLEIVEAKCELPGLDIQVLVDKVKITCSEISEIQTGYLQLNVKCRGNDFTERMFSKFILVQFSASAAIESPTL